MARKAKALDLTGSGGWVLSEAVLQILMAAESTLAASCTYIHTHVSNKLLRTDSKLFRYLAMDLVVAYLRMGRA